MPDGMLARSDGKVFNRVATAYDRHRPAYPDQLIALARRNLHGSGAVEFVNARFEDVTLPRGQFTAVLSASAIHQIDTDVSWQKAADALVAGGALALVQYFGLDDGRSADDQQELRCAMAAIAPEMAASWPQYRDLVEPQVVLPRAIELTRELATLPSSTYARTKHDLRGHTLELLRAAAADDPLLVPWVG